MNVLIVAGIAALLIALAKKSGQGNGGSLGGERTALFWAHKTGAGYVCVGYCPNITESSVTPGQYRIDGKESMVIAPFFIDPTKGEPDPPGFSPLGYDVYVGGAELKEVTNASGVYLILMPLILAGVFKDDRYLQMLLTDDAIANMKSQPEWERIEKAHANFSIGRTQPFRDSKIYRVRSANPLFSSYLYPVLLEISQGSNTKK